MNSIARHRQAKVYIFTLILRPLYQNANDSYQILVSADKDFSPGQYVSKSCSPWELDGKFGKYYSFELEVKVDGLICLIQLGKENFPNNINCLRKVGI